MMVVGNNFADTMREWPTGISLAPQSIVSFQDPTGDNSALEAAHEALDEDRVRLTIKKA